jgi:hypothetical protein
MAKHIKKKNKTINFINKYISKVKQFKHHRQKNEIRLRTLLDDFEYANLVIRCFKE